MDTSYLNLARGNRLSSYLGLEMVSGYTMRYAQDYTYVEIPILGFYHPGEDKVLEKVLRNQYVRVLPACTVQVRGHYKVEIEPCQEVYEFGMAQGRYYIEPGTDQQVPGFYLQVRKDVNMTDLPHAIRIYMRA